MDISVSGGDIAFKTPFSAQYDLVQILRGIRPGLITRNEPVDFRLAGLVRKSHRDIWHVDRVLAFSTDECSPFVINGEDIGGNHGQPCGVLAHIPGHECTCREIGTLWVDNAGLSWTLMRLEGPDGLLFLSENMGPSVTEYAFASHITGALRCPENGRILSPTAQHPGRQLTPAIRHIQCDIHCEKAGQWFPLQGDCDGADRARITEEYEVICPSTVAPALRQMRPKEGFAAAPRLDMGEAMARHRMTYTIGSDGCILCDFDHQVLMDVHFTWYLGIMYQEKCDVFGGGIHRYIPKLKPFSHQGQHYDFSQPYDTTHSPLPGTFCLTRDLWTDLQSPPDRQLDFIAQPGGTPAVAFAGGFLPLYDGEPAYRAEHITEAADIVSSRKTYPTFLGGKRSRQDLHSLRGVAYKHYFAPESPASCCYRVAYGGHTYLYMDFFSPDTQKVALQSKDSPTLLEGEGITWERTDTGLTITGQKGYAVFQI